MSLITRTAKGSKLTISEMDGNLTYLEQLAQSDGLEYITEDTTVGNENLEISVSDGTNTSKIKVNLTAPNGIVQTFTVDETGFPLGGYAGNVITFTQVSTDGNGTGLEFEVAFAGNGFIGTINFLNRGLNYEVGDIITTSNEGSGALTLTIDSIDDVDNYNRLYSTNGTNTGEIKVEKKSISQKVEQGSNVSEIIVEQNPNFGTQIVQASTDGTNEAYLVTNPTSISHQLSNEIDNSQMTISVNGLSVYRTDNTNNLQTQFRVEDEVSMGFNTGTSIKVEPTQIEQKVESGDVSNQMYIYKTEGALYSTDGNFQYTNIGYRLNIGEVEDITIDPTPFPIVGYADQTITFTQDTTSGNGTGLEVEVIFDNNGDVDSRSFINKGEGYLVGDTITTNDEGSGSLTIEVDVIGTNGVGLGTGDGSNYSDILIETTLVSINTPQITLDTIALLLPNIPTYADNAAAVADDYPEHGVYKTSTGELRIVV